MTVIELIKELQKLNPQSKVYLQKDEEGNGFAELCDVDGECIYDNDEIYSLSWTSGDVCMEEFEWENLKKQTKCVVLAP